MPEKLSSGVYEQQSRRPACTFPQSDQRLCYHFLESILCKLATGEISIFELVSVAEETGLSLVSHWLTYRFIQLAAEAEWNIFAEIWQEKCSKVHYKGKHHLQNYDLWKIIDGCMVRNHV